MLSTDPTETLWVVRVRFHMFHQIHFVAESFSADDTAVHRRLLGRCLLLSATTGPPSYVCPRPASVFTGVVASPPVVVAVGCRDVRGVRAGPDCGGEDGVDSCGQGLVFTLTADPEGGRADGV